MASGSSSEVLKQFRTLFEAGAIGGVPDGELLDRFADRRDEAAFTALVERHGPMVLRVCRGVLGDAHEAQDAFQATFLVLARKAGLIRKRNSVGPWLHGVACRVSARAKGHAARRRAHDRRAAERTGPQLAHDADPSWMWAELHEEVERLPERYRAAVVLCYLEGLSNEEAAGRLRWPVGTVKVRLSRAREKLKVRLTRRGLAPAVGLLGAASAADAKASVPAALVELTVRAASGRAMTGLVAASVISLTEGALRTMMLSKLSVAAGGAVSVAVLAVGGGIILGQDSKGGPKVAVPASGGVNRVVAPDPDEIEALKKRLLAAARQRLEAQMAFYKEGRITVDRLLNAMEQLMNAEVQSAATKADRRAAIESYVRRVTEINRHEQTELEEGRGTVADVAEVQQRVDAARLRLAEELASTRQANDVAPVGDDIETLKERLVASARKRLDSQSISFREGRIAVDRLLDAMTQVMEAERQIAKTKADRRAAVESSIQKIEQLLRDEQAKLEEGRSTVANIAEIQQRLEAVKSLLVEQSTDAAANPKVTSVVPRGEDKAAALKKAMVADAKQILDDSIQLFKGGEIDILPLLNADQDMVQAELRVAATDADRLAILKTQVERLEGLLNEMEMLYKKGEIKNSDLTRIRFHTNAAKLCLLEHATASGPADPQASGDRPGNGPSRGNDAGSKSKLPARLRGPYVVEPPDMLIVEVLEALPGRPISGERLVRPDGKISLGFYGDVDVAGLTLPEVKEKVVRRLQSFLSDDVLGLKHSMADDKAPGGSREVLVDPKDTDRVFVDVTAYNSKVYYVEGDVAQPGRFPVTGNDTVLDAIHYAGNPLSTRGTKVRLIRRRASGPPDLVMPVDYEQITSGTDRSTNYELMPGDRIVVTHEKTEAAPRERADPERDADGPEVRALEHRLNTLETKLDRIINLLDGKERDKGTSSDFNRNPGGPRAR